MSNTRAIQPTDIWTATGNASATYLGLVNFCGYRFDDGPGMVEYTLIGLKDNGSTTLEDGTVIQNPQNAVDLYKAFIDVPSAVIQQWGTSDEIIFEYVATTLGLTIIN
jgi:hypothetical protein